LTRQKRREDIGKRLGDSVPRAVSGWLVALLQQSVKWQTNMGQLPLFHDRPAMKKAKTLFSFDLVLGEASQQVTTGSSDGFVELWDPQR